MRRNLRLLEFLEMFLDYLDLWWKKSEDLLSCSFCPQFVFWFGCFRVSPVIVFHWSIVALWWLTFLEEGQTENSAATIHTSPAPQFSCRRWARSFWKKMPRDQASTITPVTILESSNWAKHVEDNWATFWMLRKGHRLISIEYIYKYN